MEDTLIDNIEKEYIQCRNRLYVDEGKAAFDFIWDLIRYNKQLEERLQLLEQKMQITTKV